MINTKQQQESGASLIEVIFAVTIFSIVAVFLFFLSFDSLKTNSTLEENDQVLAVIGESYEAVRSIRDRDWNELSTDGVYGLATATEGHWILTPTPDVVDKYTRQITIDTTYRDASGNITASGTPDPNMKAITSQISWQENGNNKVINSTFYLSLWTDEFSSLLTNGDFELFSGTYPDVDYEFWGEYSGDGFGFGTDTGRDGTGNAALINRDPGNVNPDAAAVEQSASILGNTNYLLSFWSRGTGEEYKISMKIYDNEGYWLNESGVWEYDTQDIATYFSHDHNTPTVWAQTTLPITTRVSATSITVQINARAVNVGDYFLIDDILLFAI